MFNFNQLKVLRNMKNLSGRQLAEKCGISQANISLIENGKKEGVTLQSVEKILNGMGYRLLVAPQPNSPNCHCMPTQGTTITYKEETLS